MGAGVKEAGALEILSCLNVASHRGSGWQQTQVASLPTTEPGAWRIGQRLIRMHVCNIHALRNSLLQASAQASASGCSTVQAWALGAMHARRHESVTTLRITN